MLLESQARRVVEAICLVVLGAVGSWIAGYYRRWRAQQKINQGDARLDQITIEQIIFQRAHGAVHMRIRSCGCGPFDRVLQNVQARAIFGNRIESTTLENSIISMDGREGSFLLHQLQHWVCGLLGQLPFPHEIWLMAPVSEPHALSGHQSTIVLLVRKSDIELFLDWEICSKLLVEHGSHGMRILTLMKLALEYKRQAAAVAERRRRGLQSGFEETVYELDLPLNTESADVPVKPVPWRRFESLLPRFGVKLDGESSPRAA